MELELRWNWRFSHEGAAEIVFSMKVDNISSPPSASELVDVITARSQLQRQTTSKVLKKD